MAKKTFVPQLARNAKRLNAYITKHEATLRQYITDPAALSALTNCPACLAALAALVANEQP